MNFITKEELTNKDLVSKFSIIDNALVLDDNYEYKNEFSVGDIVAYKTDTKKLGVVSFVEEDNLSINWNDNTETTEAYSNLINVPPTIGLELLNKNSKDNTILSLWEELSNGKNEDFDLKCLYLGDLIINEVPFIKSFKNTNVLVDKKFKREFLLHRKFGPNQIFKTNLYTIYNNKIGLDKSRYVYYLLEDNVVYYLGIDLDDKVLSSYLFNR